MNNRIKDITGNRYGRLMVIKLSHCNKRSYWECLCDCGTVKVIESGSLKSGNTKSCGCLVRDTNSTHGMFGTYTWVSWNAMLTRCTNTKAANYKEYGGVGVLVCDEWRKFEAFFKDMGERPNNTTLDRFPNPDGNYEPGNCRWATNSQQNRNKRNTKRYLVNGEYLCLAEISEKYEISYDAIQQRISKNHWSIERAISQPVRK